MHIPQRHESRFVCVGIVKSRERLHETFFVKEVEHLTDVEFGGVDEINRVVSRGKSCVVCLEHWGASPQPVPSKIVCFALEQQIVR